MKVSYEKEGKDSYKILVSDLTAGELDAVRILLRTAADFGPQIDSDVFSLDNLIEAFWEDSK